MRAGGKKMWVKNEGGWGRKDEGGWQKNVGGWGRLFVLAGKKNGT